jgi:DNA-directed RNA polymerase subunit RPC12/RpoP
VTQTRYACSECGTPYHTWLDDYKPESRTHCGQCNDLTVPLDTQPPQFVTKDSGERQQFDTGAQRDVQTGKGRFDLIPFEGDRRTAIRLEQGAEKYGDHNWKKGIPVSRCISSAKRHLSQYLDGDRSEDHLAAVVCNVFFIMWYEKHKPEMLQR